MFFLWEDGDSPEVSGYPFYRPSVDRLVFLSLLLKGVRVLVSKQRFLDWGIQIFRFSLERDSDCCPLINFKICRVRCLFS